MDTLRQDLRHAFRVLARNPGFTLAAVLTLGIGIGANTTIFGFMNALLLRPFDLADLDRLVSVSERHPQEGVPGGPRGEEQNPLAVADYLDLRAETPGIESVAAYRYRDFVVTEAGEPERVPGFLVTPGYFEVLGIRPTMGRTFRPEEGNPGRDGVVVLSHGFWQRRFGGDSSVIGRGIVLGGGRREVVGILPPSVNFPPGAPDLFVPLALADGEKPERARLSLMAVARLRNDLGLQEAQAAVDALSARLARQYPDTNGGRTLHLAPLRELQTGFVAPFLLMFEAAALFVLLIACANVAGLLIARGTGREREMALRAAVGASRGRIVRQLLTEGFVLSALGAVVALWIAQGGVDLIRASLPADLVRWVPGWSSIRMESRTLAFTFGLAAVTTLAFGLLPALRASRIDLVEALKSGGRGASGPPRRRLRGALVSVQVTLALVLMAGAVLMARGFLDLVKLYQGFDPERIVTMRLKLPEWQYPEPRRVAEFYGQVLRGLEANQGVESAGVVSHPPADLGPIPRTSFTIEGRALTRPQEKPAADLQTISAGYLEALSVPVLHGRALTAGDGAETPSVVLVSASLAGRFWPGEVPIGRRIRTSDDGPWRSVVGVVGDVKQYWFDRDPRPTLYVPYTQSPRRDMFLVVRSTLDGAAVIAVARARIREADPAQPVDEIRTMATIVSESASFIRLAGVLMVVLGLIALLLAAVGLYGVLAEHVARRTQEIGIRMALGARGSDVLRLVVGQTARLVGLGLVTGVLGAIALGRLMAGQLFGIVRPDPGSLAAVTTLVAAASLVAAWVPVRRATRVEPLRALRED